MLSLGDQIKVQTEILEEHCLTFTIYFINLTQSPRLSSLKTSHY